VINDSNIGNNDSIISKSIDWSNMAKTTDINGNNSSSGTNKPNPALRKFSIIGKLHSNIINTIQHNINSNNNDTNSNDNNNNGIIGIAMNNNNIDNNSGGGISHDSSGNNSHNNSHNNSQNNSFTRLNIQNEKYTAAISRRSSTSRRASYNIISGI
jgi:hypothetical protein